MKRKLGEGQHRQLIPLTASESSLLPLSLNYILPTPIRTQMEDLLFPLDGPSTFILATQLIFTVVPWVGIFILILQLRKQTQRD